jgi:hypothetical protein
MSAARRDRDFLDQRRVGMIMAPPDGLSGAEVRWQGRPPRSGARHPKRGVDKTPAIGPGSALALAATGDKRHNPSPLIVTKLITIQPIPAKISFGIIILDQEHQAKDELSPRPSTTLADWRLLI